ncbi:MAG: Ig-like domain-containing protein [Chloroflexi bacterium]|nr:Ig-like domain-containing protein [Chloroflexota bacterium]
MSNRSYVGVDNVYLADITQDDADAYAAGAPVYFAPVMKISAAPKTNSKTQYANNKPWDAMNSKGETVLDVEITGLTVAQEADLLNNAYDPATARATENGSVAPYKAVSFRAKKTDGTYRYYQFLKGRFSPPSEEFASESDTPDPKGIKLTFTAIRTTYEFAQYGGVTDSAKLVKGDSEDAAFSGTTWFDAVQVPTASTPSALTCTPSPADGATGVAVSANITLTFNNALAGNVENGIILTTAAGVVKACARTIDAARKVVTLNPTTDMGAATDYLIIVPGIVDIYGQSLADAVYNFTTA